MANSQRTNSPIDEGQPWEEPQIQPQKPQKKPKNDWEKLYKSKKYPTVATYIAGRIEHYQKYLPGGEVITSLSREERADAWERAVIIISELEAFEQIIESQNKPVEQIIEPNV